MNARVWKSMVTGGLVLGSALLLTGPVLAQEHNAGTTKNGATAAHPATAKPAAKPTAKATASTTEGKEVTLTGQVVDLHCFMTGDYISNDHAKCTADCLRAGVPAVLETKEGLVFVSHGSKSAGDVLAPLADKNVEVRGKLYTKNGVRYLDLQTAKEVAAASSANRALASVNPTSHKPSKVPANNPRTRAAGSSAGRP